jgi:hypothetical protein
MNMPIDRTHIPLVLRKPRHYVTLTGRHASTKKLSEIIARQFKTTGGAGAVGIEEGHVCFETQALVYGVEEHLKDLGVAAKIAFVSEGETHYFEISPVNE